MKIKTKCYGVFYRDGKAWRGPVQLTDGNKKTRKAMKKEYAKKLKKKTKIFESYWQS